jgi:2-dehydro-3-deoxyphosphogluconate aldolase/(4S)-4-hydroxy-2-oxoglutarate aldolase
MLVGAGTVLTAEQADRAIEAGAEFIVAPGCNPKVVKHVLEKGYPMTPGIATASEIEMALDLGIDFVKFFPAEANGGLPMIKALAGPYVNVSFMPTGGVSAKNLADYLSYNKIVCCGGTWMVKKDLVAEGRFDEIEKLSREAADIVKSIRG